MDAISSTQESTNIPSNLAHIEATRARANAINDEFKQKAAELKEDFHENKSLAANTKVNISIQAMADHAQHAMDKNELTKSIMEQTGTSLEVFSDAVAKTKEKKYEKELEEHEEAERKAKRAEQEARIENIGNGAHASAGFSIENGELKKPQKEIETPSLSSDTPKASAPVSTATPTSALKVAINVPSSPPPSPTVDIQV